MGATLATLLFFVKRYPMRTFAVTTFLVLGGLAEGLGIVTLLPLLSLSIGESAQVGIVAHGVLDVLARVGLAPTLEILLAVIVAGVVLKAGLTALGMRQAGHATATLAEDLRMAMIKGVMAARWDHFTGQSIGKFANAMSGETLRASSVLLVAGGLLAAAVQVVVYSVLALLVLWYVTLGALVAGVVIMVLLRPLVGISRRAGEKQTGVLSSLVDRTTDSLISIKPLKAMARERSVRRLLEDETLELGRAQRKQITSSAALMAAHEALIVIFLGLGMYLSVRLLSLPFDQLLFMALLFQRTATRVGEVQSQYQTIVAYESSLWSIQTLLMVAEDARETYGGTIQPTLRKAISLRGVAFGYGSTTVLDRLDVEIPAGRFTAITGPSGIGKTTLLDLVAGLHAPTSSQVLIDDVPMSDIDLRAWRSMIGYVPQEPVLLHDTIFVNVALKDSEVTRRDVEAALQAAGVWDFVVQLDNGLDSTVGERGLRLSGGQRQRIAIARALVRRPALLLLDEATTGLDAETERSIAETLRTLRDRTTIVAVTHQDRLVQLADAVIDLGESRFSSTSTLAVGTLS